MSNPRVRKIADRIQVIVAQMLERRIKDPRLGFVTITDVRVTGDSQQATIFYTVLGEDTDLANTAAALESAKGLIRSEVAKQLGMRHAPSLTFVPDAIPEAARHLDEVLAQAKESDAAVEAARAGATYAGEADPYKKPREIDDDADVGRGVTALRSRRRRQAGRDDVPRRRGPRTPPGRHPQGRPRRHPRPDGDRGAGARRRARHPPARAPDADREGVRRHGAARRRHHDRRRRG